MTRTKILFVAESVTLAQVVRLATLGKSLPNERYDVHFAASDFDPMVFSEASFAQHQLFTLPAATVFKAMEAGKRLYEKRALVHYVEADLALIDAIKPDLIVGDFRLSLSTSAELRNVPWATLINAYFSPFAVREGFPVPDHPIIGLLGEALTEKYFPVALPKVFDHFAAPVNAVRRKYGLSEIGSLLQVLTHADFTLYPDVPELTPVIDAPHSHRFLGPVLWAPKLPMPQLRGERAVPLVYVTLGSSGKVDVLPQVLEALSGLPIRALVATAGRTQINSTPANITVATFVPGDQAAREAALVISNGGSTTGYQALAAGTPVLGLPSNLDQFLTMQAIERRGAGLTEKVRSATPASIRRAVERMLEDASFTEGARSVQSDFDAWDAGSRFRRWVDQVVPP